MPVPNPGLKVGVDSQKVKFVMIVGRSKIVFFRKFEHVPGQLRIKSLPKHSCAGGSPGGDLPAGSPRTSLGA